MTECFEQYLDTHRLNQQYIAFHHFKWRFANVN